MALDHEAIMKAYPSVVTIDDSGSKILDASGNSVFVVEDTQKKLDKALKRNLNKEIKDEDKSAKTSSSTTSTSDLAVEEPISEDDEQMEE